MSTEKLSLKSTSARNSLGDSEWSRDAAADSLLGGPKSQRNEERAEMSFFRRHALLIHAVIFILYAGSITALAVLLSRAWARIPTEILYSPARVAADWEIRDFHFTSAAASKYIGPPRPELERTWAELLAPMNIRLKRKDIDAFGRGDTAVQLSDGTGDYIGTLNVYHELHCVRWLHKYIWQDEYWPDLNDEGKAKNKQHSEHCLQALREFAQCHADPGMIIYSWGEGLKPGANSTGHQCVNWPKFSDWAGQRTVNIYEPGLMVHPRLGPVYPNGDVDKGIHDD